jgi:VWFA-related protein
MRLMRIQIAVGVCGILLVAGARAQQPAMAAAGSSAASTGAAQQVVLPVTVRDKKGQLVTDLQKSDLTLTQDGRPQTITSLTRQSDEPFRIGLIVDTSRSMSNPQGAEIKAAEDFLNQVLPAGTKNQAFLIHFDREVELLEDFTSDKSVLDQQLDQLGPTRAQHSSEDQGPETSDSPSLNNGRRDTNQLYDAIYLACDQMMKNKPGRKVLVVFSNGADHGSKETMNDAVDSADHTGVQVYTIFMKGEADRAPGSNMPGNNRRGMGYPGGGYPGGGGGYPGGGGGYPGGGGRRQPEPTSSTGEDGKRIMAEIAQRTGAHAYEARHTADLTPIYKLIDEEINNQYLLTYTPDKPDTEGDYHKVAITTDKKDDTVSTREGYYGKDSGQ